MTSGAQQVQIEEGTVYRTPPTPIPSEYRTAIPVSRQAARDAYMAMEHNANGYTMGQWYVWYLSLEVGESLFAQKFSWVKPPKDDLVKATCEAPDSYPFDPGMPSSDSSLQTSIAEERSRIRRQFATQRMALLQDSPQSIQESVGST